MKHYTGLDISVKETSVCIVDETGKICREVKVASHPDDLIAVLNDPAWNFERIGMEAGPLSQWLFEGLARAGLPVICIETRHTKAFLKAQPNKTDRNDARGIAQMMRVNLYRPVHVKTLTSQKRRALLTARKLLQEKAIAIENDIRGLLRNFGLKVGMVGTVKFEERIRELVDDIADLREIMEPLLMARKKLRDEFSRLHKKVLNLARNDKVCRQLMTIPGESHPVCRRATRPATTSSKYSRIDTDNAPPSSPASCPCRPGMTSSETRPMPTPSWTA